MWYNIHVDHKEDTTMQIVRHHTDNGYRVAVIVSEGHKWLKLAYIGETHLKKVKVEEKRYMVDIREARPVDIRRVNKIARRFGASRKVVQS
jgi:hypothetical protein